MWTGILLVSRVVILIVNASTSTSSPNANILLIILIATSLLMYSASAGLLYKKWYLSVLEMSYLFNLIILAGAFLFYQTLSLGDRQKDQLSPAAATSVCIALGQLVCTLMFHITKQILPNSIGLRAYEHFKTNDTEFNQESPTKTTTQDIEIDNLNHYSSLRESLLI